MRKTKQDSVTWLDISKKETCLLNRSAWQIKKAPTVCESSLQADDSLLQSTCTLFCSNCRPLKAKLIPSLGILVIWRQQQPAISRHPDIQPSTSHSWVISSFVILLLGFDSSAINWTRIVFSLFLFFCLQNRQSQILLLCAAGIFKVYVWCATETKPHVPSERHGVTTLSNTQNHKYTIPGPGIEPVLLRGKGPNH